MAKKKPVEQAAEQGPVPVTVPVPTPAPAAVPPKPNQQLNTKKCLEFFYEKDGIDLKFILRIDIKTELRVFKELLTEALTEVDAELAKHN